MTTKTASTMEKRTIHGVSWSIAAKFFRQFMQLFFQIALARLLTPAEFGVFSILLVFINLADVFRTLGLGAAIIQRKEIDDTTLNTVFWINISAACLIYLIFFLLSPWIAQVFAMPAITNTLRVYSLVFIITSLNSVQEALLQKNLEFKRLFIMDSVAVLTGGLAALYCAMQNMGVYTLVLQYLVIAIVSSIILWSTSKWKPSFKFSWNAFREIRGFSMNILGNDLLNLAARNIDNLAVGKILGATALGIYSRAYFLMLQPVNFTHQVLARVMFPVLSLYQEDRQQMKKVYLLSTRLFGFVVFPLFAYVMVSANELIGLLLGEKWLEVAYLLRIFCIYGIVDTIGLTTIWIFKATGETKKLFRWSVYSTIIIITAIFVGLRWGISGVAWAYSLSFLIFLWIPGWMISFRIINLSVGEMLNNLKGSFFAAVLAGLSVYLIHQYALENFNDFFKALVSLICCISLYILLSLLINRATLQQFVKRITPYLFRKKFKPVL